MREVRDRGQVVSTSELRSGKEGGARAAGSARVGSGLQGGPCPLRFYSFACTVAPCRGLDNQHPATPPRSLMSPGQRPAGKEEVFLVAVSLLQLVPQIASLRWPASHAGSNLLEGGRIRATISTPGSNLLEGGRVAVSTVAACRPADSKFGREGAHRTIAHTSRFVKAGD